MGVYVLNEWLWADIGGGNGAEARELTLRFLEALSRSEDQILVVKQSPFESKAWAACKSTDMKEQKIAAFFARAIRQDLDRCRLLRPEDRDPVPEPIRRAGVKLDDEYLLQAQQTCPESRIVTTDQPLLEILRQHGIPCEQRDPFLVKYLLTSGQK